MGGISQYVLQLIAALAELDGDNRYSIFHSRKDKKSRVPDAPNFARSDLWTPSHHKLERWTLSAELSHRCVDVLHSPDFIPPLLGARRKVITVHDLNFLYYPQFLTRESLSYYERQIGWAVRAADHIAADSEATRMDLIEKLNVSPGKVTTVYLAASNSYGIKPSQVAVDNTLEELNLSSDFILFVGTVEPRKNLPVLIHAYELLRREKSCEAPLVLVGGRGWLDDQVFATIKRLGIEQNVIHLTGIDDRQLAHIYRAAAVLAMPSFYEGFGLPVLEAMHCDCPVVSSNRGSLPEVVGSAGILLDPDDVDSWVRALDEVLTDEDVREKMVLGGREQAGKFSWKRAAESMLSIYRNV